MESSKNNISNSPPESGELYKNSNDASSNNNCGNVTKDTETVTHQNFMDSEDIIEIKEEIPESESKIILKNSINILNVENINNQSLETLNEQISNINTSKTSDDSDQTVENKSINITDLNSSTESVILESTDFPEHVITDDERAEMIKTEMTDEEIMHHLDEIENIVLHSPSFIMQDDFEPDTKINLSLDVHMDEDMDIKPEMSTFLKNLTNIIEDKDKMETKTSDNENKHNMTKTTKDNEITLKDTEHKLKSDSDKSKKKSYIAGHADKLLAKENVVKDRLQRLSRVLEYSYPIYKKWLHKVEHNKGTAVCRLDKSIQGPSHKRHTNRWKFTCQKIITELNDDIKSVGNSRKNNEEQNNHENIIWRVKPSNAQNIDIDKESLYPHYIISIAKDFEEFLQNDPNIYKETKLSKDTKHEDRKEFTGLNLRANYKNEIMVIIVGCNVTNVMIESVKKYFKGGGHNLKHVKSVYCKSFYTRMDSKNYAVTTFLCGLEVLEDKMYNIKLHLSPRTNFWCNIRGVELITKVINEYLPQWPNTTLLEIGCGIGLISILMSYKFDATFGVDAHSEIEEAKKICDLNGTSNARFIKDDQQSIETLFEELANHPRVVAIVNHNASCGKSIEMIARLRKLASLKRLVVIVTFTKQSIHSIMELMNPYKLSTDELGNPFIPQRCCLIDTVPEGTTFELAMLMERRFMRKVVPNRDIEEIPPPKTDADYIRAINPMFNASEIDLRNQIIQKRSFAEKELQNNRRRTFTTPTSNRIYNRNNAENAEVVEVLQNVKQQQVILEKAAKKLRYSSSNMDPNTARQLKSMLHSVLEQTNEIQNKLPHIAQSRNEEPRDKGAKKNLNLPVLLPGKSKKYHNIAPLEPNTHCPEKVRGNDDNKTDRDKMTRRPIRERLNGYVENGSPPREINETFNWENRDHYEPQQSLRRSHISPVRFPNTSPQRYKSHSRSIRYNTSPSRHQYHNQYESYRNDDNQRERYRESSPQRHFKNYRTNPNYRDRQEQLPRYRSNYSPSVSHYSRSTSRQSVSPRRTYSRSRSPIHYRQQRFSREVRTSLSPTQRYRQQSPPNKRYVDPSFKTCYKEDNYHNERVWRRNDDRNTARTGKESYETYSAYEREYHNRLSHYKSRDMESERYENISDHESRHVNSPMDDSNIEILTVRSRSSSPIHDRWNIEKHTPSTSRNSRTLVENVPESSNSHSDNSLHDPRLRTSSISSRDVNMDELPDDAKDPWGEDNAIVINPIANVNDERIPNWTKQSMPMNVNNQWSQQGMQNQHLMQMQGQVNIMSHTSSWGSPMIHTSLMGSNPNLSSLPIICSTPNIMQRPDVVPDLMMGQSVMCQTGMVPRMQMCPSQGQNTPYVRMQSQNWNYNSESRSNVMNPRPQRNPNSYSWRNPNYKGYNKKSP